VEKELIVGRRIYAPDVVFYAAHQPIACVQLDMRPVKFLGLVPGIGCLLMPPWLVAYLLIAIPSVSLIKKLTGIY
jgi:hypothetical protein